jgi:hypothetical protein
MSRAERALGVFALLLASACSRSEAPPPARDTPPPGPAPALMARAGQLENASLDSLPAGPGRDMVMRSCTSCHAATLITQQHKTPEEWKKTVEKMAGWGAPVGDTAALVASLAERFPAPAARP